MRDEGWHGIRTTICFSAYCINKPWRVWSDFLRPVPVLWRPLKDNSNLMHYIRTNLLNRRWYMVRKSFIHCKKKTESKCTHQGRFSKLLREFIHRVPFPNQPILWLWSFKSEWEWVPFYVSFLLLRSTSSIALWTVYTTDTDYRVLYMYITFSMDILRNCLLSSRVCFRFRTHERCVRIVNCQIN